MVVGKPWAPNAPSATPSSLQATKAFNHPGWLKYGMEWQLTPLPDGRTLVETSTRCEPTSADARAKFAAYWTVVRPFSGLLRRDMLAALARATEGSALPDSANG